MVPEMPSSPGSFTGHRKIEELEDNLVRLGDKQRKLEMLYRSWQIRDYPPREQRITTILKYNRELIVQYE